MEHPYDNTRSGATDAFVTKLATTGNVLAYSTYFGWADDDEGHGIAVDKAGNAYVTGFTEPPGYIQTRDVFVAKFSFDDICCTDSLLLNSGYNHETGQVYQPPAEDNYWWVVSDPVHPPGSGGHPAAVMPSNPAGSPIPGTRWIAAEPNDYISATPGVSVFRYCFCLSPGSTDVTLKIGVRLDKDSYANVFLNGINVPILWSQGTTYNDVIVQDQQGLTKFISGRNCISITVIHSSDDPMGIDIDGYVKRGNGSVPGLANCCDSCSISGTKYRHPEHTPIEGWTITLRWCGGPVFATAKTDVNGNYKFSGLPWADWRVTEAVLPNWVQLYPPWASFHFMPDKPWSDVSGMDFENWNWLVPVPIIGGEIVCIAGDHDQFVHDGGCAERASPGPALQAVLDTLGSGPTICTCTGSPEFDCPADGQWFAHTFSGFLVPNCLVYSARLQGRLKATGSSPSTDMLHLLQDGISVWSIDLNSLNSIANVDSTWDTGDTLSFSLDLSALPPSGSGPSNILAALQDGGLDMLIGDDTEVDFLDLIVETCSKSGGACCPINLSIDTTRALNGGSVDVALTRSGVGIAGGFDLLVSYDASALTFLSASTGSLLDSLEWEYFTYRTGAGGNCTGGCPNGLLRLIAIADLDNGPSQHPVVSAQPGELAILRFQVTGDRNFIGQCIPVRFFWNDCGDNVFSSVSGDTTYVDQSISSPDGSVLWEEEDDVQFPESSRPQGLGAPDSCLIGGGPGKPLPERRICFRNGWVCINEPPDDRGDLNLNGVANEIGDAVLYTNYFVYGSSVWSPPYQEVQMLASDINDDGIVLTVADLIYLIRIITGDEQPFPPGGNPKMTPYANSGSATLRTEGDRLIVSTTSLVDVGGAWLVFRYSNTETGEPMLLEAANGMTLRYNADAGELRVLVHPLWDGQRATIGAGNHDILSIPTSGDGTIELVEVQMSDARGALLSSAAVQSFVPKSYALLQNYPNPFNAGTIIAFDLIDHADWDLTIYNVLGQTVRRYEGSNGAGRVSVTWDGRTDGGNSSASGIYLYRISANGFTATKKMTLVK